MQTKLFENVYLGLSGSATMVKMSEIRISVIGFAGTQVLASVKPPGTTPGTGILVSTVGINDWAISGQFNSNILPNANTEYAGQLVVEIFITTSTPTGFYYNIGSIDGAATSTDFNGLNYLKMRAYKSC